MRIYFLSAKVALTKTINCHEDGSITKDAYPHTRDFTSYTEEINTPVELCKVIVAHANKGHCLLKGQLAKDLKNEPRKGMTSKADETEWVCLDFDRVESPSIQDELAKLNLADVACVVQWSSSQGLPGTEGTLSCHVFMMLEQPCSAPDLKLWLQNINFTHYEDKIRLGEDNNCLVWPLDVTTCQNDKLLYIAPPIFKGLDDPIKKGRIEYLKGALDKIPPSRIGMMSPPLAQAKARDKKNQLRRALGLKASTAGTSWVGEYEVTNKPSVCRVTSIRVEDEWTRLNLNGGESFAWWHWNENYELLFSFKTDEVFRTKEIIPEHYADLQAKAQAKIATPTTGGDLVLGFSDHKSAKYYRGTWNEERHELNLFQAAGETQVYHYYLSHGLAQPAFIPIWNIVYDIKADWVVNTDENKINMFRKSSYMRDAAPRAVDLDKECPTIKAIVHHMLGNDPMVVEHFERWFACIFQLKGKPKAAWVAHGDEGTGKGVWFNKIAAPLLGEGNTVYVGLNDIESEFNDWMKDKLLIMVDEIDVNDFKEKGRATSIFKARITEDIFPCRAMRTSQYNYVNSFQFFFSSNENQPVYIPQGDRRYNVARYQPVKLSEELKSKIDTLVPKELMAYACYLKNIKTSQALATEICDTEDRRRIAKLSVSSAQEVANMIIDGDVEGLWCLKPDEEHLDKFSHMNDELAYSSAYLQLMKEMGEVIVKTEFNEANFNITREELGVVFRHTVGKNISTSVNRFTTFLRHLNIDTIKVRRGDKLSMGFKMRLKFTDEFKQELVEYYTLKKPRAILRTITPTTPKESTNVSQQKASKPKRSNGS